MFPMVSGLTVLAILVVWLALAVFLAVEFFRKRK